MASDLKPDSILTRAADMVAGKVDEDIVLTSIETGLYYQVSSVGGEILDILQEPTTLAALFEILQARFQVSRATLEAELPLYIQQLAARRIVVIA